MIDDERRVVGVRTRRLERRGDGAHVLAVLDDLHLPAIGRKALRHILAEGDIRRAFDGDAVAVVHGDELAEPQRAGQGRRLVRHALHHAAVAHDGVGVVVDDREARTIVDRRQVRLRHRHADRHRKPLPQRAGRRLHAARVAIFRVPRRQAAILAEGLEVIDGQPVAEQMQQRILQHGRVARREHKPVARRPGRILRVVLHLLPERKCRRRAANGQARMAAVGLLHRLGGQHAHGGDGKLVPVHLSSLRYP